MKIDNPLMWIASILVVIGALNWGLIGAFGFNLVAIIPSDFIVRTVYVLVGLSALLLIVMGKMKRK